MAVFDTMRHIRPNVSTVCIGMAASMGAFLLASGHQGKRYSLPNSRIMIHQPLGGAQGQVGAACWGARGSVGAWRVGWLLLVEGRVRGSHNIVGSSTSTRSKNRCSETTAEAAKP